MYRRWLKNPIQIRYSRVNAGTTGHARCSITFDGVTFAQPRMRGTSRCDWRPCANHAYRQLETQVFHVDGVDHRDGTSLIAGHAIPNYTAYIRSRRPEARNTAGGGRLDGAMAPDVAAMTCPRCSSCTTPTATITFVPATGP